jgi:hypothetical protein
MEIQGSFKHGTAEVSFYGATYARTCGIENMLVHLACDGSWIDSVEIVTYRGEVRSITNPKGLPLDSDLRCQAPQCVLDRVKGAIVARLQD